MNTKKQLKLLSQTIDDFICTRISKPAFEDNYFDIMDGIEPTKKPDVTKMKMKKEELKERNKKRYLERKNDF